jgi:hypothetical protein
MENEFHIKSISYQILDNKSNYKLIEIQENEYRKCMPIYFSRILKYKKMGYLLNKNPHAMKDYLVSTCCFNKIDNYYRCNVCNKDYPENNPFFLNCNIFLSYKNYNRLAKRYGLGIYDEIYRDQRRSLSNPEKLEIYAAALHPDRIMKILELSNDIPWNIDKYI